MVHGKGAAGLYPRNFRAQRRDTRIEFGNGQTVEVLARQVAKRIVGAEARFVVESHDAWMLTRTADPCQ